MSDHDVEALARQIEALKAQLETIKKALWAITLVFLMPGAVVLISIGTQMNRLNTTEETAAANTTGLRSQERIAAGQAAQLSAIAQSIARVERLLEQMTQERLNK